MKHIAKVLTTIILLLVVVTNVWGAQEGVGPSGHTASATSETHTVTFYFAGTGDSVYMWEAHKTIWKNHEELLATLYH